MFRIIITAEQSFVYEMRYTANLFLLFSLGSSIAPHSQSTKKPYLQCAA